MATATLERTAKLNDVAKAAGVSQGTVSNVFNRPQLVREEVRERVRSVAKELGYRGPDPKGRLLRAGKVNAIGVTTTEPLSYFFTDPYVRVMMTGVTQECDASGVGISLVSAASEEELSWNIRNALVDGLVLFCLDDAKRLIALARERQLPFVALSLGMFDATVSAVGIDNVAGAYAAAKHLTDLGHRRFAILTLKLREHGGGRIGYTDVLQSISSTARDRTEGYARAMAEVGIDPATVPIYEAPDAINIGAALEALFASPVPPTAIIAQADRIALAAIEWLQAHGFSVPEDISVVGFDGVPESAVSDPPLTTVAQPITEIGRQAVRLILAPGRAPEQVTLHTELVVRGSTAPPKG
jgi:DNA-binding LacI/PurR family transcriptional regulator